MPPVPAPGASDATRLSLLVSEFASRARTTRVAPNCICPQGTTGIEPAGLAVVTRARPRRSVLAFRTPNAGTVCARCSCRAQMARDTSSAGSKLSRAAPLAAARVRAAKFARRTFFADLPTEPRHSSFTSQLFFCPWILAIGTFHGRRAF